MANWLGRWTQKCVAEDVFEILRPASEIGIRFEKQFARGWNLLCCHCTETYPHISAKQNYISMQVPAFISVYVMTFYWILEWALIFYYIHNIFASIIRDIFVCS